MFKRVIVATDLSPASNAVVSNLCGLKTFGTEECLLVQCLSPNVAASVALSYDVERMEGMLNEQKSILEKQGFVVEARNVIGSAKRELGKIAVEEDYSLIVVGTQGQSLIEERVLGGTAYGIISKSQLPVLAVPVKKIKGEVEAVEAVAGCSVDFSDHILFATDFSESADNAFVRVEQLAAEGVRKITFVHVQDKVKFEPHLKDRLEEFNQLDRGRLENLKNALLEQGNPEVDIEVCYGIPFEEITRLTRERGVKLVIMGTKGRGFLGELVLGSVSHNVVRHSTVPVLLVPDVR